MSPRLASTRSAPGFVAQLREHRLRVVEARDAHAARGQRQRDPARADRELERRAVSRQLGQQVDRRVDHRRIEHPGRVRVVGRGDALAEVPLFRCHRRSVPPARPPGIPDSWGISSPVALTAPSQSLRRALAGLAIAGAVACAALLAVAIHSVGGHHRDLIAIAGPIISGAFIGTGVRAWYTRPENRFGALMVALGFTYCFSGLIVSTDSWPFVAGLALIAVPYALLVHILLSFPSGRLLTPLNRALAGVMWALATVGWWGCLVLEDTTQIGVPANPLLIEAHPDLFVTLTRLRSGAVAALIVVVCAVLVARWRASTASQRRAATPVYLSGGLVLVLYAVWAAIGAVGGSQDLQETLERARVIALATVPFAFLAGLLRSRVAGAAALRGLMERLGERGGSLRDDLAQALGDPSLELAYWLPERKAWVDAAGADFALDRAARAQTPVERDGRPVAMIVSDPAAAEDRELVQAVGGAAALALENERLAAELRANLAELQASRARIVESGDAARRRIERDLHDGAQQQLVAVALQLRAARTADGEGPGRRGRAGRRGGAATSTPRSRSCASSPAASIPPCSPTAGSSSALRGARHAHAAAGGDRRGAARSGCPRTSRPPPTSSSPRR